MEMKILASYTAKEFEGFQQTNSGNMPLFKEYRSQLYFDILKRNNYEYPFSSDYLTKEILLDMKNKGLLESKIRDTKSDKQKNYYHTVTEVKQQYTDEQLEQIKNVLGETLSHIHFKYTKPQGNGSFTPIEIKGNREVRVRIDKKQDGTAHIHFAINKYAIYDENNMLKAGPGLEINDSQVNELLQKELNEALLKAGISEKINSISNTTSSVHAYEKPSQANKLETVNFLNNADETAEEFIEKISAKTDLGENIFIVQSQQIEKEIQELAGIIAAKKQASLQLRQTAEVLSELARLKAELQKEKENSKVIADELKAAKFAIESENGYKAQVIGLENDYAASEDKNKHINSVLEQTKQEIEMFKKEFDNANILKLQAEENSRLYKELKEKAEKEFSERDKRVKEVNEENLKLKAAHRKETEALRQQVTEQSSIIEELKKALSNFADKVSVKFDEFKTRVTISTEDLKKLNSKNLAKSKVTLSQQNEESIKQIEATKLDIQALRQQFIDKAEADKNEVTKKKPKI